MAFTSGAIAVIALIIGLICWKKRVFPRAVPWMMLIAGLGIGGMAAGVIGAVAGAANRAATGASQSLFGVGVFGLAAIIIGFVLFLAMRPKGSPTKFTPWLALVFPALLIAAGGSFADLGTSATDWFGQAGQTVSAGLTDLMSSIGDSR